MSALETQASARACAEMRRWIAPLIDGELGSADDQEHAELGRHLAGCADCAREARQLAAFKAGFKAAATRPSLPEGMRDRLRAQVAATLPDNAEPRWRVASRRAAPALAAAAMVAMLLASGHRYSPVSDEAIRTHQRGLPLEIATTNLDQAAAWVGPKVDFAPRLPALPSATLVGARLAQIRDRPAAYLVYNVSGNRVSVFVFDPGDLPIDGRRIRRVAGREVFLDEKAGYHVALLRNGGLGYAFASDLDEDRMFQLVSSTLPGR